MFDIFSFTKGSKLIDRPVSTNIFFAQQSECQFAKRRSLNGNPEFVVAVTPDFFDTAATVAGFQAHRTILMNGQVD